MNNKKNIRKMIVFYISFTGLLATIIIFSPNSMAYTSNLYDAENSGYVDLTIEGAYDIQSDYEYITLDNGNGVFYGQCIEFTVTHNNMIDESLYLTINHGRKLICQEYGVQDMIVTQDHTFYLTPGETETFKIYAMCMDMYEDAPLRGYYYDLGYMITGNILSVVSEINSRASQNAAGQCALWAVTDDAEGYYLSDFGASSQELDEAQDILDNAGVDYVIGPGHTDYTLIIIIVVVIIIIVVVIIILLVVLYKKPNTPNVQPNVDNIQQRSQEKNNERKFCQHCGKPLERSINFCINCGKKL